MINVGNDIHKKRRQTCLKDEKGRLVEELSIPNTTEGAEQLARMLTTYGEAKIALESTDLVRADLVAESYVPTKDIREQRTLLRQRKSPPIENHPDLFERDLEDCQKQSPEGGR